MSKTTVQKPAEVTRNWYVVDASENTLGRVATQVATLLIGKQKPSYTPHVDGGDYVIVINSDKLKVTGAKMSQKKYYRHSGYPGSTKEASLEQAMENDSRNVIIAAVKGMLPRNKLSRERLNRLKVYKDENHNHEGQKPKKFDVKAGK